MVAIPFAGIVAPIEAGLYHSTWVCVQPGANSAPTFAIQIPNKTPSDPAGNVYLGTDTTLQNPGGAVPATTFNAAGANGLGYVGGTLQRRKIGAPFLAALEVPVATLAAARETLLVGNFQVTLWTPDGFAGWSVDAAQDYIDSGLAAVAITVPAGGGSDRLAFVRVTLRSSKTGRP